MNHMPPVPIAEWAWFFDIDGTLANLEEAPHAVAVDGDIRRLLAALFRRNGGAVALVSGRAVADVDALFPGMLLPVAGQHGAERRTASGAFRRHAIRSQQLLALRDALHDIARHHPGLQVEDKGLSLAVHYRKAPRLGAYVHRAGRLLWERSGHGFELRRGKRVVELLPRGSDKGAAVTEFMLESPFAGRTPVFLGDDVSDEAAFAAVNIMAGVSVKVGSGPTVARYRLANVAAVRRWLEAMPPDTGGHR